MMHGSRRFWIAAALIAVVLVVGFALSVPHVSDSGPAHLAVGETTPLPTVYFHDAYSKGTHSLTLKLAAPNACTAVTGSTSVQEGEGSTSPDTILIALDMPADQGVCLEVPATTTLSLSAAARQSALFTISINGSIASTTRY